MSPDRVEIHPGITTSVQSQIEFPRDRRGRIRWNQLKANPDRFRMVVETLAAAIFEQEGKLNQVLFTRKGYASLGRVVPEAYPGGMWGLKEKLGITRAKKPTHFYTQQQIEAEASEFLQQTGTLSTETMRQSGKSGLARAIFVFYPGRTGQLRKNLGLDVPRKVNSWTPEQIEAETFELHQKGIAINKDALEANGRADLANAISRYYPGATIALKEKLGIPLAQKSKRYWTAETIEQQALDFYRQFGALNWGIVREKGRLDLRSAIAKKYPGGLVALKEKLGIMDLRVQDQTTITPSEANEQLRRLIIE